MYNLNNNGVYHEKYILIILLIFTTSLLFSADIATNAQEKGTSTDNYAATTIYTPRNIYKTIIIKNTGGSNSLDYYLRAYPSSSGGSYVSFASGTLTHGSQADCFINNIYYKLVIGIKATTGGSQSTYSIDYIKR